MGYLDVYSGTIKIDLGNGYHAEIKKYLNNEDYKAAQDALMPDKLTTTGSGITAKMDTSMYSRVLVQRAVVAWNLDDAKGDVLPLPPTNKDLDDMPQVIFNKIHEAIEAANEERSPQEQATFLAAS